MTVCILVMGYCQGVISHPDIVIFYRTASTTGTVFLFTVFDFSFFINFRGALILCEMKFRKNNPYLMYYLVTIDICAGVICDTPPKEGKHTGLVRITSTINEIFLKLIFISCLMFLSIFHYLTVLQSENLELSKYCHPS